MEKIEGKINFSKFSITSMQRRILYATSAFHQISLSQFASTAFMGFIEHLLWWWPELLLMFSHMSEVADYIFNELA